MGNFLDGTLVGKEGTASKANAALCLETQKYPDFIHHAAGPSGRLDPGQTCRHTMAHRFSP